MCAIIAIFSNLIIMLFFNIPSLKDFVKQNKDSEAVNTEIRKIYNVETDTDLALIKINLIGPTIIS